MAQNGNGLGADGLFASKEFFEAAAGVALIIAGASLLMSNENMRQYVKDGLRAAFPNLDLTQLEQPLNLGIATIMPDVERYLKLRSM